MSDSLAILIAILMCAVFLWARIRARARHLRRMDAVDRLAREAQEIGEYDAPAP